MPRTNERASRGRSAFFALNAVGARFGNLHPHTILKLYRTLCLLTLLFGSELWMLTKTELLMLERVHRKILRTIQGLPTRCPSTVLNCLLGTVPINTAIVSLNPSSLARTVLLKRLGDHGQSSIIHSWALTLEEYALPSIPDLKIALPCSKLSWKKLILHVQCIQSREYRIPQMYLYLNVIILCLKHF